MSRTRYPTRRRRGRYQAQGSGGGVVFLITVMALTGLIYIGTRGKAGDWVREQFAGLQGMLFPTVASATFTPASTEAVPTFEEIVATQTPDTVPTPTTAAVGETVTEMVEVPGILLYAVQVGAFQEESNAQVAAQQDASTGGAGFVWRSGEIYRVFHAGLSSNPKAADLRDALRKTDREVSLYPMEAPGMKLEITSAKARVQDVQDAFDQWKKAVEIMENAPSDAMCRAKVETLRIDMSMIVERLEAGLPQDNRNTIYQGLLDLYKNTDTVLEHVLAAEDGMTLTAAVRSGHLEMVRLYSLYVQDITSTPAATAMPEAA